MIKYTKYNVIEAIFKELPNNSKYRKFSLEELQSLWFVTKRRDYGLELTSEGNQAFLDADIEYFDRILPWPTIISPMLKLIPEITQFKIKLSRKITCPYYIYEERKMVESNKKLIEQYFHNLRLYDSHLTVWIDLQGGVERYIKDIE